MSHNKPQLDMTYSEAKRCIEIGGREAIEAMQDQPEWITQLQELDYYDIRAIAMEGCASGAYMPAVSYFEAVEHMSMYGDAVLEYLEDTLGEVPSPPDGASWAGLAVFYLSHAVELWCVSHWQVVDYR